MLFLVCLVLEEALAWKCFPRGQCGFFELKFMTVSLRFFVTFFHRTALGNGNFGLHVQACFQIAVLRMLLCSEMLSCAVANHFLHNSWPCLAFQRPSQPRVALFFLRLGHATVSLKRPGKLSNRSVRRDAPTVLREA